MTQQLHKVHGVQQVRVRLVIGGSKACIRDSSSRRFASIWHMHLASTATAAASAIAVLPAPVGAHTSTELPSRNSCTASCWKSSRGNWNVWLRSCIVRLLLAERISAST